MHALALYLDVGTGVMKGALLNLSCCVLFHLTWDFFLDIFSIVRSRSLVVVSFDVPHVCCRLSCMC